VIIISQPVIIIISQPVIIIMVVRHFAGGMLMRCHRWWHWRMTMPVQGMAYPAWLLLLPPTCASSAAATSSCISLLMVSSWVGRSSTRSLKGWKRGSA
jgi:hypothetical protein